jgi:heterodisulfide reductase subunit A
MADIRDRYDALVVGGGIAGMQAALDLGEQGFEVLLVERTPSIGGVMVGLNKVFPTLDCSSCICTPRMAESAHHPRIRLQTYTEVRRVEAVGTGFAVELECKPRYLHEETCIGCDECELACPVEVPHEFDYGLGARRAIYIPHGNAIPQKAVLDVEHCIFCGKCEKVCPTNCLDFTDEPRIVHVDVGAVIVATGLDLLPMGKKPEYGGDRLPNVMSPLAMERIQSSNGPYGRVLRPADGKIPRSIAYIQCAGSRDRSIGVPYCSRVCCMYALKQALLLRHYIHDIEVALYYMDIRAFGKGYEQFYRRAVAEGVKVIKGKVARITEADNFDLLLRVELLDEGGRVDEHRYDLVVLTQGLIPAWHAEGVIDIEEAADGFVHTPEVKLNPSFTTLPGVFVGGVAAGPKDIPDAIVEAGEAAMAAANYLTRCRWKSRSHAVAVA